MMDIARPHPPSAIDAAHEPLSALVVGDAAAAGPRVHGWPGTLFIAFACFMSVVAAGVGAVVMASFAFGVADWRLLWRHALVGCVWSVLQWRLASEVRRFSRWGWYGAMAELAFAAAVKVFWTVAAPGASLAFLVLLAIDVGLMRYFWKRRAQFDIDLGG